MTWNYLYKLIMRDFAPQEIQHIHRDVAEACLTGMLEHWLTQTDPPPSWSTLIEALRSPALGRGDIASEIETIGSLPDQCNGTLKNIPRMCSLKSVRMLNSPLWRHLLGKSRTIGALMIKVYQLITLNTVEQEQVNWWFWSPCPSTVEATSVLSQTNFIQNCFNFCITSNNYW